MRKDIHLGTYKKIRSFFSDNKDRGFTAATVGRELNVDMASVEVGLQHLYADGVIDIEVVNNKTVYKFRKNEPGVMLG